jgi:DNA-binding NarL/FixJ family response regulator
MIRILIADDHSIVRECLRQVLSKCWDMRVTCEAANGTQVLEQVRNNKLDLVLLDMCMPGVSGVDLVKCIRLIDDKLPILILSMHDELLIARWALAAGANGYLTKACGADVLTSAIRTVAFGGRYVAPRIIEQMANLSDQEFEELPHERLSPREQCILSMLGRGYTINEIAGELAISNKTVSGYKTRVMNKMNFANIAELMRYAFTVIAT